MDDRAIVGAQIGRPSRAPADIVARCHLELPVVIRMPPLLDDGTPFPTRFWLTCPLAVRRISRLEAAGGVESITTAVHADPDLSARLERAHRRYAAERDAEVPPDAAQRPTGGVGGIEGEGAKCLHAHYADYAAGNDNPIGELVAKWIEPLDDVVPCVIEKEDRVIRNPEWSEPR